MSVTSEVDGSQSKAPASLSVRFGGTLATSAATRPPLEPRVFELNYLKTNRW